MIFLIVTFTNAENIHPDLIQQQTMHHFYILLYLEEMSAELIFDQY